MFDYSCRVPDRLKSLPKDRKAAELVDLASFKDQRYALMAAGPVERADPAAAHAPGPGNGPAGEGALCLGQNRIRLRRHSLVGREIRGAPHGGTNGRLGTLAMPWHRSQTEVIREYLFPKMPHRPVSTLAVYLAKLMAEAGKLDPSIKPDLKKVIANTKPKSFEADLAKGAIEALEGKKR